MLVVQSGRQEMNFFMWKVNMFQIFVSFLVLLLYFIQLWVSEMKKKLVEIYLIEAL